MKKIILAGYLIIVRFLYEVCNGKHMNQILLPLRTEKGYTSLFKASVFLCGYYLIAMSQVGSFLYDKDISAHKAKFAIEVTQNKPLEKIDCAVLQQPQRVECMVAKHEIRTLDSSLGLLDSILNLIVVFALLAGALSIIGFLFAPFYKTDSPEQP